MSKIKCASPDCQCKKGTPKTLSEAIQNGIEQEHVNAPRNSTRQISTLIEQHVLDYLRQHFGVAYLALSERADDEAALAVVRALAQSIGVEVRKS